MPTMNGVDEEHVISNLDKLSSIPKFDPTLDLKGLKLSEKGGPHLYQAGS